MCIKNSTNGRIMHTIKCEKSSYNNNFTQQSKENSDQEWEMNPNFMTLMEFLQIQIS